VSTTHALSSRTTALHGQFDTEDNDTAGFRNVRKYPTTQNHISEDQDFHQHCFENLKSHIKYLHSFFPHCLFEFEAPKWWDNRRALKLATIEFFHILSVSFTDHPPFDAACLTSAGNRAEQGVCDTFEQVLGSCKLGSVVSVSIISKESGSVAVASRCNECYLLICQTCRKDYQCVPAVRCSVNKWTLVVIFPLAYSVHDQVLCGKATSLFWTLRNGKVYRSNIKENSFFLTENTVTITHPILFFFERVGIIGVYFENHTKHLNTLRGQNRGFFNCQSS
jgi:hypothetical protein